MRLSRKKRHGKPLGFSVLEMMLATLILLVGLVGVAQLVPATILFNQQNRSGSIALVFAQRELDQFLDQPFSVSTFSDALGNTCSLGNAGPPGTLQGSPVLVTQGTNSGNGQSFSQVVIDFSAAQIPNYFFTYVDPTDPRGVQYEVRWGVIVTAGAGAGTVSAKRFILGVRQLGGNGFFQPVTLDTMVSR